MPRPPFIAERRAWARLPISIPFFVNGKKARGKSFLEFATALNVSGGGVLLATRSYIEPGTKVLLEIPVLLVNKALLPYSVFQLQAIVLRCAPRHWYFLLGLRFEQPLSDTNLSQVQRAG